MTEQFAVAGSLRRARRLADLSQRQLAERAGVAESTVARLEGSRPTRPTLATVDRLLRAAGYQLAMVPLGGGAAVPPMPARMQRDHAGRHYPAHLDVRRVRCMHDWWYGPDQTTLLPPPTHTFDRRRAGRDDRRKLLGSTAADDDERLDVLGDGIADQRVNDIIYAYLPQWRRR